MQFFVAAVYFALFVLAWLSWRLPGRIGMLPFWQNILLGGCAVLHAASLLAPWLLARVVYFGVAQIFSATMLWAVLVYLVSHQRLIVAFPALRVGVLCAAFCAVLASGFSAGVTTVDSHSLWLSIHLLLAMLSCGFATLSFFHSWAVLIKHTRLNCLVRLADDHLPPLLVLESVMFAIMRYAFWTLTATVLSGALCVHSLSPIERHTLIPKMVLACVTWLLFACLLWTNAYQGVRGAIAARWLLVCFVLLLMTIAGTQLYHQV